MLQGSLERAALPFPSCFDSRKQYQDWTLFLTKEHVQILKALLTSGEFFFVNYLFCHINLVYSLQRQDHSLISRYPNDIHLRIPLSSNNFIEREIQPRQTVSFPCK